MHLSEAEVLVEELFEQPQVGRQKPIREPNGGLVDPRRHRDHVLGVRYDGIALWAGTGGYYR